MCPAEVLRKLLGTLFLELAVVVVVSEEAIFPQPLGGVLLVCGLCSSW
jgi:hypothetical protein